MQAVIEGTAQVLEDPLEITAPLVDAAGEPEAQPVEEVNTPLDVLCDEIIALKRRVTQLESVAHAGHSLDEGAIAHIASVAATLINEGIRKRLG